MTLLLACRGIKKSFGDRALLKEINLNVHTGERIGLLGQNGAGKSTLANIIFGSLSVDGGSIEFFNKNIRVIYLTQSSLCMENCWDALSLSALQNENEGEILFQASKLGLKNSQNWEEERLQALSGGEEKKRALATVFSSQADLLILDEPSNNLDVQGIEWLLAALRGYQGAVLIISHDRYFLDQSVSRIVEVEHGDLHEYAGNYSFYRQEKKRRYRHQLQQFQAQEKRRQIIEENIEQLQNWSAKAHRESRKKAIETGNKMGGKEKFRAKAKKRDQSIKSKVKRLEKMLAEGTSNPQAEFQPEFAFAQASKRGKRLVEANCIGKSYGARSLFNESSFYVLSGEKVGIIGANGCGKSTLMKALMGELALDQGQLFISPSARIALISQDMTELERDQEVYRAMGLMTKADRQTAVKILKGMGLSVDLLSRCLIDLSPGEKRKIQIACAIMDEPDLLILDEPFHHLDLLSREILEEALYSYNGSILLVSHDRYLLENVCGQYLFFHQQRIQRFEGNLASCWQILSDRQPKPPHQQSKPTLTAEEKLLLETRIAYLCNELNMHRAGTDEYLRIDQELTKLIHQKRQISKV